MRTLLLCFLLATVVFAVIVSIQRGTIEIPAQWNPWSPLQVTAQPDRFTRFRLSRMQPGTPCQSVLADSALRFEPLPDRETGEACGFRDAVQVNALPALVGEAFALSCRTAVTLALWEQHVVQPAAQRHFDQRVVRYEHFGSYACRNVYGRPAATRSRHATAEAWDLAGFVLEDGRRIRVARDWNGEGVESQFLREVRTGACRFFDGVLSPDYNAAHHDHLHLDRGPYRLCR